MSPDFTQRLTQLRAAIDALDSELIALLKKRIDIIHEVADLKRANTPAECHIRPGREGAMHQRIFNAFEGGDFPPAAALSIWRNIIGSSTHLESPITVAVAGAALRWHAREYFGRNVKFSDVKSIKDALNAVEKKKATIALLPAPSDTNIGEWAELAKRPELKAFASLPVVLAEGETPRAVAVAAVTPEASGDDVSLLLVPLSDTRDGCVMAQNKTHKIIGVPELSTDPASLGTVPKPITDPTLQPWNDA